jgi:cobalt-zinc-cadmium resistance protein CzcA
VAQDVPVRQCPKCFCCHRPAPACPECKHVYAPEAREPEVVAGELAQIDADALRKKKRQLVGRARTLEELRTIVEWQVAPRLRMVPGVIEVIGFGGALKQYRVTLDPGRMAAHGVDPEQVRDALRRDNALAGGGYLEHEGEQIVLRADARFRGIEDIAATTVRTDASGTPVLLGQLGEVDTGPALRQGAMTRDARGEVVGASVLMLKGQNSREVVARVKSALAELAPRLPKGLRIDPYYDRADFIDRVLTTVAKNLSEGALIVVGCGNLRDFSFSYHRPGSNRALLLRLSALR